MTAPLRSQESRPRAAQPVANGSDCPRRRPASDISAGVGLCGLFTLLAWIAVCRKWPAIMTMLGVAGPHAVMDGPYAALMTVVFTTSAMAAWSLLVDNVHRRPSTGLDLTMRRPMEQVLETAVPKLAGIWATFAIIGVYYCIGRWYWQGPYPLAMQVLGAALPPLILLSLPYVLWIDRRMVEPRDHAWHFGAMLMRREGWRGDQVARHARIWAIKAFFGAFMISILPIGFAGVVNTDLTRIAHDPVAMGNALIALLFTIDVQIGTVGYLCTLRPLDAHIRSGNPLLAGWVAALVCYPPFVMATMGNREVLAYEVHTGGWSWALAGHDALLWGWAGLLVALTAVYAWATFAFGLRFSNLTYRGVLTNGPYRFTRHPAYLFKNLFWWASTLPFAVTSHSWVDIVRNTALLSIVSAIYYWRARTEEAHLLAEDAKYRAYHAWMGEHALITRTLGAGARALARRLNAGRVG